MSTDDLDAQLDELLELSNTKNKNLMELRYQILEFKSQLLDINHHIRKAGVALQRAIGRLNVEDVSASRIKFMMLIEQASELTARIKSFNVRGNNIIDELDQLDVEIARLEDRLFGGKTDDTVERTDIPPAVATTTDTG